jgi:hypothetical protein
MDLKQVTQNYAASLSVAEREAVFGKKFDGQAVNIDHAQKAVDDLFSGNDAFSPVGPGREVMLLLPQYKHTNPATLFSLLGLWDRATMRATMHFGDAFIVHTRNKLAQSFLASDCPWSLWIDDDMVVPIGDAGWFNGVTNLNLPKEFAGQHTLKRLLAAKKKLVGALYFGRHPKGKPMFAEGANDPALAARIRDTRPATVQATKWVGTGCMLIHRDVFLDIQKKFPHLAPKRADLPWEFFSPAPDEVLLKLAEAKTPEAQQELVEAVTKYRPGTGEDVTFCRRAQVAGHQPHVDLGLIAGHVGGAVYGPTNTTS